MNRVVYHKIVRDRIPEIIETAGKKAFFEYTDKEKTISGLEAKLSEELAEYLESHSIEEMADLLEVIHGILYHKGISWEELESVRQEKRAKRGGFEKGIHLLEVEEP
ncbi:MAG: nucleoside triphosphate pyrophosphohydrolase [Clostridiales bacterium]|nr:nucleoside triphosphate pyrophosphohydrolase [Clostridiales bacterium]